MDSKEAAPMFLRLKKGLCRAYLARIEELIESASSADPCGSAALDDPLLTAHLRNCAECREALEAAQMSTALLREAHLPQLDPGPAFASRVIAGIHEQEKKVHSEFVFWNPIEVFARRMVLASSALLLILSSALYQMRTSRIGNAPAPQTITDSFADIGPDQSTNDDEMLVSLVEQ
jgi:hypothetical protein